MGFLIAPAVSTKSYDKTYDFNFNVVNNPYLVPSNILEMPADGVYVSHIISFVRACDHRSYLELSQTHFIAQFLSQARIQI